MASPRGTTNECDERRWLPAENDDHEEDCVKAPAAFSDGVTTVSPDGSRLYES